MPKRCSVCVHEKRTEIDAAVLAGEASRSVAKAFGISEWSLTRHRLHHHVLQSLVEAQHIRDAVRADTLLGQLQALQEEALSILDKAKASNDLRTALAAVGQARECVAILARVMGEIKDAPTVLVQQQFVIPQSDVGMALDGLLRCGAITLSEGEYVRLEEGEETVSVTDGVNDDGGDIGSGPGDRCAEPPLQIG